MKIKIKEAKRRDINSIVRLSKELADFFSKIDDYYKSGKEQEAGIKKWLLKNLGKRNFKILIVKDGNKILAFGIAKIEKPKQYCKPKKIGKLVSLYVKEKHRKKGIGKQIFDKFLEWFKSRNIKYIELSVDSRNKIATSAYKKYGFFEYMKKMRMDL